MEVVAFISKDDVSTYNHVSPVDLRLEFFGNH